MVFKEIEKMMKYSIMEDFQYNRYNLKARFIKST